MTTLWAYFRYVRRPGIGNAALVFVSFLLSLTAKSMAVTLPVIVLVLDYWPLRRFAFQAADGTAASGAPRSGTPTVLQSGTPTVMRSGTPTVSGRGGGKKGIKDQRLRESAPRKSWTPAVSTGGGALRPLHTVRRLLFEKAPLLVPMLFGVWMTLYAVQSNRVASGTLPRVMPRLESLYGAIITSTRYLQQTLWPSGLAIPYPRLRSYPVWEVLLSLSVLLAISLLAWWRRKKNPYLLAGWLWYLVTLLPAIGLVQSGPHAQADRYTYIPLIGIFIMIAWGAADLFAGSRLRPWVLGTGAVACIVACTIGSRVQVGRWENTVTIFSHSVEVTKNNGIAHNNLGMKLMEMGDSDAAMAHFQAAIKGSPRNSYPYLNLGNAYKSKGDFSQAIVHYEKALSLNPKYANASYALANVYLQTNRLELSEKYFLKTLDINRRHYMAHLNLGAAYSRMGKSEAAIARYEESLKIRPEQHLAHYALGLEYLKLKNLGQAEIHFRRTLEFKPDYERAFYQLGGIRMRQRRFDEAIGFVTRALELNSSYKEAIQMLELAQRSIRNEAR